MEIFFIFGLWAFIVALTPFGIWAIKARLSEIERRLDAMEIQLASNNNERLSTPRKVEEKRVDEKPVILPPPSHVAEAITKRKDIFPIQPSASQPATREPWPTMKEFIKEPEAEPFAVKPSPQPVEKPPEPHAPQPYVSVPQPIRREFTPSPVDEVYGDSGFELPAFLKGALSGGKLFVTLGVVLLFMGCAMLFKYAAQFITIPLEMRFMGVAVGAIGMVALGAKQMGKRRDWGLYMQGGGLGLLFLTVFSAFRFYALISSTAAFVLLLLIGAATFSLSVVNDAMALSVLAIAGGFLAPILTATGGGSHIALFSYYLAINLVIFAIAWKKSWRVLNSLGFVFTFAIGALWGGRYYVPEFYNSVQLFLCLYFLLYTGIGLLYAARSEVRFTNPIDFASIFGVPLVGCGLQFKLVQFIPHGNAISSALLGLFYAVLFLALRENTNAGLKKLREPFMWLSLLFLTLAVPFAFSSHTTAMLWAMEGATLFGMLHTTGNRFYGYAGGIVLCASNLFMLPVLPLQGMGTPFMNTFFLSAMVMAVTHIAAAHLLAVQKRVENTVEAAALFSIAGMAWWFAAGCSEFSLWLQPLSLSLMPALGFGVASALAAYALSQKLAAPLLDKPVSLILPATLLACLIEILRTSSGYHPAQNYGFIVLPLAFAAHYYWLWKRRDDSAHYHVPAYIALVLLAGFELGFHFHNAQPFEQQKFAGWLIAAAGGLFVMSLKKRAFWLLAVLQEQYRRTVATPLVLWVSALCLYTLVQPVLAMNGAYMPFINVVELAEIAAFVALLAYALQTEPMSDDRQKAFLACDAIGFGVINAIMLRVISSHYNIPYFSDAMWQLPEAMTALTILWTVMAMGAMILSSRFHIRAGWAAGAGLLGVVIVKLFLVDLANIGTLSRIISFMGVGMLSLLLGYIAPMPLRKKQD